ncbi:hypothetical protein V2J09_012883 [Rumex salicifolius]
MARQDGSLKLFTLFHEEQFDLPRPWGQFTQLHSIYRKGLISPLFRPKKERMESLPPNFKPSLPADDTPELDLYTIPFSSSWFSWDSIHETERSALKDFFDASSYSRSPKIYKEYRDFIISKHREDPTRKLTFTDVRKSLVGDVSLLRKVFLCLESWGLINFNLPSPDPPVPAEHADDRILRVEDGVPIGVKVVVAPNSLKPMPVPPPPAAVVVGRGGPRFGTVDMDGNGFNLPPLASYSDVFADLKRAEGLICGNCKEKCQSKYYDYAKHDYVVCIKCFENGVYGENKTAEDFRLNDCAEKNGDQGPKWTEAETLLLLESILRHGEDWDLVAQSVHTKTVSECILRLIEMPFGELMLGSHGKVSSKGIVHVTGTTEGAKLSKDEPQETDGMEDAYHEQIMDKEYGEHNEEAEDPIPLPKKRRIDSSDPDRPLMEQVALISDMVGPKVKAAAVNGAVSALCNGNPLLQHMFLAEDDIISADDGIVDLQKKHNTGPSVDPLLSIDHLQNEIKVCYGTLVYVSVYAGGGEKSSAEEAIPLPLRMRAAVATSLGTAAARARLMANQEEREMEFLVASVIETQLKKLQSKVKYFDELEDIIKKEHDELWEMKECVVAERMDILKKIVSAGISR